MCSDGTTVLSNFVYIARRPTETAVIYNLLLKVLNRSSAFPELGIIVRNGLLCHCKIIHAHSTILYDTEIITHRASTSMYSLTFRVRCYTYLQCISTYLHVVIATKPEHRLQIRPTVHNYWHPLPLRQVTPGSVQ